MQLSKGRIGAMWWCWGDLKAELKSKRLPSLSEGVCCSGDEEHPSKEETMKEGW
jgi:hypothetical protein